jgi:hypothetical protein
MNHNNDKVGEYERSKRERYLCWCLKLFYSILFHKNQRENGKKNANANKKQK